jgi:spore maturation protein CgeB
MKVLVVGKHNMLFWPQHVCDALDELGHHQELFLFNDLGFAKGRTISIVKRISMGASEAIMASSLRKKISTFCPDIVIFVSAFFIPKCLYAVLAEMPNKPYTIGWSGDAFDENMKEQASILDKLYSTDSFFVDRGLGYGWNTAYLPLAFNPRLFLPPSSQIQRSKETIFIGNPAPDREELLSKLSFPIFLIGSGWGRVNTGIHRKSARSISLNEVVHLYQTTYAVVNMRQGVNVVNGLNMRSFEAPACGTLLLHDDVEDLKRHYVENEEVLVYHNAEELSEMLCLIGNDTIIAKRGQERAWDEHMYRHRIAKMIEDTLF